MHDAGGDHCRSPRSPASANSFFRPAVLAGVPNLVDESELADAARRCCRRPTGSAAALGPIVGGAIVSGFGTHLVYWLNAATFLFSALLLVRIPGQLLQSEQGDHARALARPARGHSTLSGESARVARPSSFGFGLAMLAGGLINVAEIFLATRSLGTGAFGYGLLWSASGVGLVAGEPALTGALLEDRDALAGYASVFLPWALGLIGAAVAPNVWVAALAMVRRRPRQRGDVPMTVLIVQRATLRPPARARVHRRSSR